MAVTGKARTVDRVTKVCQPPSLLKEMITSPLFLSLITFEKHMGCSQPYLELLLKQTRCYFGSTSPSTTLIFIVKCYLDSYLTSYISSIPQSKLFDVPTPQPSIRQLPAFNLRRHLSLPSDAPSKLPTSIRGRSHFQFNSFYSTLSSVFTAFKAIAQLLASTCDKTTFYQNQGMKSIHTIMTNSTSFQRLTTFTSYPSTYIQDEATPV